MQTKQGNMLASLRNVQHFLDDHAAELPGIAASGARKKLDALVAELDAYADTQSGSDPSAKTATQKHYALRTALVRDHMAPIAKIAGAPFADMFVSMGRPADFLARLNTAAGAMLGAVTPIAWHRTHLAAWAGPGGKFTDTTSRSGKETEWFELTGRVTLLKVEADGDLHLQLENAHATAADSVQTEVEVP